jgi:hypothetical protein
MNELGAMLISCAIEGPVAYAFVKQRGWQCRGPLHAGLASVVATCVSHPQAWAFFQYLHAQGWGFWLPFFLAEAFVYILEGLLICWMAELTLKRAMIQSTVANTVSAAFGLVLTLIGLG